ncbi:MAG: hypothetical protein ACXWXD_13330 [Candidatus Deferrimicrobiaceae bacterium]
MSKARRNHYFRDMINRRNDLETAVHVLTDSPAHVPGDSVGLNGSMNRKRIFGDPCTPPKSTRCFTPLRRCA